MGGDCSEASSFGPHLLSLLPNLYQLRALGSSPVLVLSWPSGFLVYLASNEQLFLSNSSLNLAKLVPPTHSQKSNPGSSCLCGALATSPDSPVMERGVILNICRNEARKKLPDPIGIRELFSSYHAVILQMYLPLHHYGPRLDNTGEL